MRNFGSNKFWSCLTMFSLKWWRNPVPTCFEIVLHCFLLNRWGDSAETRIEIVLEYFRWSDEEIQLSCVLKLPYNVFVEAMRGFGWHKFLDCLRIFSLKWWRILAQASFEIVSQCFLGSDEEIRLRRVLKLSYNVFVEAVRNFGWNKFWKYLTMISLKWCRNPAKTCFELVLECFRWSDEELRLKQVLKLSDNDFVDVM